MIDEIKNEKILWVLEEIKTFSPEEIQQLVKWIFLLESVQDSRWEIIDSVSNEVDDVLSPNRMKIKKTIDEMNFLMWLLWSQTNELELNDTDFAKSYYILKKINPDDFFRVESELSLWWHDSVSSAYYKTQELIEDKFPTPTQPNTRFRMPRQSKTFDSSDDNEHNLNIANNLRMQKKDLIKKLDEKMASSVLWEIQEEERSSLDSLINAWSDTQKSTWETYKNSESKEYITDIKVRHVLEQASWDDQFYSHVRGHFLGKVTKAFTEKKSEIYNIWKQQVESNH